MFGVSTDQKNRWKYERETYKWTEYYIPRNSIQFQCSAVSNKLFIEHYDLNEYIKFSMEKKKEWEMCI